MKKISKILCLFLVACLLVMGVGCKDTQQAQSGENESVSETQNKDEKNEKQMLQREFFKNNPISEVRNFDVKLRDSRTTRSIKVLSNGMRISEVSISPLNSEKAGDPVTVVHFSDVHFNAVNDKDKDNAAIMALYENRDFNKGNRSNTIAATQSLEFGKLFDRTVITGDIMDYYSFGNMDLLKSVITDKYDVLMTLGNHEACEIMGSANGGLGLSEKYTLQEKYEYLNKNVWSNNVYLDNEIISDSSGNEKAMLVLMDNQSHKYLYSEAQYNQFAEYISTARTKQIPILIFQHCPISTGWADENGKDIIEPFDIIDNPNGKGEDWGINSALAGGKANGDKMTQRVYDLIVNNADVIKGVFCGHEHNNVYTEIMAKTPAGENAKIPQYTVSGNYTYSNIIQITVL